MQHKSTTLAGQINRPIRRPYHFPKHPKLDRLIASGFDPAIGPFDIPMYRRNARDLRKGLFGPAGLREVPGDKGGEMTFVLPNGWTLRLLYDRRGYGIEAGEVLARCIPPTVLQELAAA